MGIVMVGKRIIMQTAFMNMKILDGLEAIAIAIAMDMGMDMNTKKPQR